MQGVVNPAPLQVLVSVSMSVKCAAHEKLKTVAFCIKNDGEWYVHITKQMNVVGICNVVDDKRSRNKLLFVMIAFVVVAFVVVAFVVVTLVVVTLVVVALVVVALVICAFLAMTLMLRMCIAMLVVVLRKQRRTTGQANND